MKSLFYCFAILVAVAYAENLSSEHRITVKDKDGNIFTSYSAQKYSAEKRFTCSLEGTSSAKWSISPEVEGIVMRENGGLIIDASQIRPKRTYTITATMTEGNTTLPFDIEIYGCEYGDFLVINTSVENTRMELYNGEEMVYNNSLPSTLNLCVPVATYRYILFYPLYGGMYVTINDEHGVRYHTVHMQVPDTLEGSFSNDPKTRTGQVCQDHIGLLFHFRIEDTGIPNLRLHIGKSAPEQVLLHQGYLIFRQIPGLHPSGPL